MSERSGHPFRTWEGRAGAARSGESDDDRGLGPTRAKPARHRPDAGGDGEDGPLPPAATSGGSGGRSFAAGAQGERGGGGNWPLPGRSRRGAGESDGFARVAGGGARLRRERAGPAAVLSQALPEAGAASAAAGGNTPRSPGAGGLGGLAAGARGGAGRVRPRVSPALVAQPVRGASVVAAAGPVGVAPGAQRGIAAPGRGAGERAGGQHEDGGEPRGRSLGGS